MLFNSFQFLVFFVVVLITYYALPHRHRWVLLFITSCIFYMSWKVEYIVLIGTTILVCYVASLRLMTTEDEGQRRLLLFLALAINLGLLAIFKYANFVSDSVENLFRSFNIFADLPHLEVLLPVGISFYTFQTLSYTIDVYRRDIPAEKHLGIFATFVMFFPQLVAGPIERATNLLPQFRDEHHIRLERFRTGGQFILQGLFKKVVVADLISVVVNEVYAAPEAHNPPILIIATVFFAFQIYCDFSGYSDIAIGVARMMGFDLMLNFRQPYFARSIREFWQRWHISLSTWFRDYLYIPLGGNRVSVGRWYLNMLIVFVVSGLWHGANWTFVVWGFLHGIYQVIGIVIGPVYSAGLKRLGLRQKAWYIQLLQIIFVFILVNIAWVFFRAENVETAFYIVGRFFDFGDYLNFRPGQLAFLGLSSFDMAWAFVCIFLVLLLDLTQSELPNFVKSLWSKPIVRRIVYVTTIYIIIFFGVFGEVEFIYFQF